MTLPSDPVFWNQCIPDFLPNVPPRERYEAYSRAKAQFDAWFPDATCAERDRAILKIAEMLGI
jgi:hypothetical protein